MSTTIGHLDKDRAGCQIAKTAISADCLHEVIISNKVQEIKRKNKKKSKTPNLRETEEKSARCEAH